MSNSGDNNQQEISYIHRLVNADVGVRTKTLKQLEDYLRKKSLHAGFTYDDFLKIWKGLYYCMYMADKPLFQEDLADNISCLIHILSKNSEKLLFFEVAMDTFAREWHGMDNFRTDKFMMLLTRVLRQCLIFLARNAWNINEVQSASGILERSVIKPFDNTNIVPLGLKIHLAEIILEEVAKVGKESLPDNVLYTFMYPFCKVLVVSNQKPYIKAVQTSIIDGLIKQSELGIKYQEDVNINEVEIERITRDEEFDSDNYEMKQEKEEEEGEEFVMDPRAGGVDVHIPTLKPDYNKIADLFVSLGALPDINQQKREMMYKNVKKFLKIANGIYPITFPPLKRLENEEVLVKDAVSRLDDTLKRQFSILKVKKSKSTKYQNKKKKDMSKKRKISKKMGILRKDKTLAKEMTEHLGNHNKTRKIHLSKRLKSIGNEFTKSKQTSDSTVNNSSDQGKIISSKILGGNLPETNKSEKPTGYIKSSNTRETVTVENRSNEIKPVTETLKKKRRKNRRSRKIVDARKYENSSSVVTDNRETPKISIASSDSDVKLTSVGSKSDSSTRWKTESVKHVSENESRQEIKYNLKRKGDHLANSKPSAKRKMSPEVNGRVKIKSQKSSLEDIAEEQVQFLEYNGGTKLKQNPLKENFKGSAELDVKAKERATLKDPFDEPLKEGETEIFIPNKKSQQLKGKNINFIIRKSPNANTKGKLLKINLRQNVEHDYKHYKKIVKSSPGIPFSAHKKPLNSVLKTSSSPNTMKKFALSRKKRFMKKKSVRKN